MLGDDPKSRRIGNPEVDFGFTPIRTINADPQLRREIANGGLAP
jgi:hypothetical protein